MSLRILLVTGASGGHIFPAIGLLERLKARRGLDTLLILPGRAISRHLENPGYKIRYVSHLRIKPELLCLAPVRLLRLVLESIFALLEFRPHLVIGFGSIASVPMVILARGLGIRTLIHEQNVVPGRANRFLARFAGRIAVSFDETQDYFRHCREKLRLTGNPLRKGLSRIDKTAALNFFGFSPGKFTLLVIGGSQGASRINRGFLKAVSGISGRSRLQIIHLSGDKERPAVEAGYGNLGIDVRVFGFFNEMQYAYSACDLVICRGGATTVRELIFFAIPAVIVPYPYAYGHQMQNARVLERALSARIIEDSELDSGVFRETIAGLVDCPDTIDRMRRNYDTLIKTGSDDRLMDEALSLIEHV